MTDQGNGRDADELDTHAADGLDAGTGDPGDDRAYLQDEAPAQVDDDAVRRHETDQGEQA